MIIVYAKGVHPTTGKDQEVKVRQFATRKLAEEWIKYLEAFGYDVSKLVIREEGKDDV